MWHYQHDDNDDDHHHFQSKSIIFQTPFLSSLVLCDCCLASLLAYPSIHPSILCQASIDVSVAVVLVYVGLYHKYTQ